VRISYEEALERIRACKQSGETRLDLGSNQLTTLSPEIGQLTNLQDLWLKNTSLDAASHALVQRLKARGVDVCE